MTTASGRLAALYLTALLGVLAMLGAVLGRLAGGVAVVGYVVLVSALALAATRAARRRPRAAAGRTCTCCTSTVHDPIRLI